MIRRLIKLDPATGNYAEVDAPRLKREALALLDYINIHIDPKSDEHSILKWVVPLCEAVLNDTLKLPVPYSDLPLKYAIREGQLPNDFEVLYSDFAATLSGSRFSRDSQEKIFIDGLAYAYVDFEE
jgi:hypothetical protein